MTKLRLTVSFRYTEGVCYLNKFLLTFIIININLLHIYKIETSQ